MYHAGPLATDESPPRAARCAVLAGAGKLQRVTQTTPMPPSTRTPLRIEPVAGALGAEISGVALTQPLEPETVDAIRAALLAHLVVFFRDQTLKPAQQLRFAGYFGAPDVYPMIPGLDGFPQITEVRKLEHETVNFGGLWHSDTVYLQRPPMATLLLAVEVPAAGGDTLWANQYLAYETLSPTLRSTLESLRAVNTSAKADVTRTREDSLRAQRGEGAAARQAVHPVVRTHPETGRKALFVNFGHTVRFDGWSEEESRPLLEFLFRHQTRPEFTCRFRWRPGSVAFWDNRCTQHNPINDYPGQRRLMHRVVLAGDVPR